MANRDPSVDPNSWWVSQGALMQSASIFASGRFSIRAKFAPIEGLVFALWTFHEEEHRDAAHLPNGEVDPQFVDGATGWSTRLNHEIDIEIPASCSGLCATSATGTCAGQFDTANLNTYVFSNSKVNASLSRTVQRALRRSPSPSTRQRLRILIASLMQSWDVARHLNTLADGILLESFPSLLFLVIFSSQSGPRRLRVVVRSSRRWRW